MVLNNRRFKYISKIFIILVDKENSHIAKRVHCTNGRADGWLSAIGERFATKLTKVILQLYIRI